VGKPKRSGGGFSAATPTAAPKQQVAKSAADHAAKEQQAVALINQGKLQEAEALYGELIAAGTNNHIVYGNLAAICGMQGRFDELIEFLRKALELNPKHPDTRNNLGNALKEQGDLTAAIASYNKALELKPNHPDAHNNLSLAELLTENYKNGWIRYECRFQAKSGKAIVDATPPSQQWNGEEIAKGSKLLLVSEQGLGDTLQFMRYATALRMQGASVSLCAPPKMHTLIQVSGIEQSPVTPRQANQVSEGQWIPLLSVPKRLDVSPGNPVINEPYIKATDELIAKWAGTLEAEQRPVIGINWQGNPKTEKQGCVGVPYH
jgi:hypothetical protein